MTTHALGTYVLLEAARERGLRYVQVSTDEVYGSIEEGSFTEESPLAPSSPYSATKAGADLLVWPTSTPTACDALICRGSNNYGPYQYPEKLIPLMVLNAIHGDGLPVYGDGSRSATGSTSRTSRAAIGMCSSTARRARSTTSAGPTRTPNLEVVQPHHRSSRGATTLIEYVTDRPGHDRRYSLVVREGRARSAGSRASASPRGSSTPSPGTATTRGGGSRSARATTAPTTSASTGARSASWRPPKLLRRQSPSSRTSENVVSAFFLPPLRVLTVAVAVVPLIVTSVTSSS